jgi:hypothetical protein
MYASATKDLGVRGDALMHRVEGFEVNADAEHARNPCLFDGVEQLIEIMVEVIQLDPIQMTMRIKKHFSKYLA